jgi:hypothetical protein
MDKKLFALPALSAATLFAAVAASPVQAATVTFTYDQSFGAVSPDGPAPWATAVFDDGGSAGSVTLTMSVAGTVGEADVTAMYFNLDPSLDPNSLGFNRDSGTGPAAANTVISTGSDAFGPLGGDGIYDIEFEFPPSPGNQAARFNAGEDLVYTITGTGISASSFNVFGTPGPGQGNPGPYLSVARFQSTGPDQNGSDWVGAVPVPAAVWLFGSGLLGLVGIARRRRS